MEPLISTIVPVYNVEQYLPRCLQSISEQTYRNLEIILVDDGSSDGSGALCEAFAAADSRVRVIHQPNKGLWAARNTGMDAACGEFLFLPDGDDYFHHDLIRYLLEAIESGHGYDLAIAGVKMTFSQDEDVSAPLEMTLRQKNGDSLVRELLDWRNAPVYPCVWNKLYRKETLSGLRFRNYPRSQDLDFNLRLMMHAPRTVEIPGPLYFWVQREGSLTHRPDAAVTGARCLTQILFDNLQDLNPETERYRPLLLSQLYKKMVLWKGRVFGSDKYESVTGQIREWDARMRESYRSSRGIRPDEKAFILSLLRLPRLTHALMRLSGNL